MTKKIGSMKNKIGSTNTNHYTGPYPEKKFGGGPRFQRGGGEVRLSYFFDEVPIIKRKFPLKN